MNLEISQDHPIWSYFQEALSQSLHGKLGLPEASDVDHYLVDLLVNFLHRDGIYSVKDHFGRRVQTIAEMVAEGDVRLNADSFTREREVHRHIGDFLLFWSGLFPESLKEFQRPGTPDAFVDVAQQGKLSYHLVSTFEYPPFDDEAPTFRKLSEDFEAYQEGLRLVRASFNESGWSTGFSA